MRSFFPRLLVTLLTLVSLFGLAGYQITGRTAATRLLGRLSAALIEADRWLPAHQNELDLRARERPEGFVQPADLPVVTSLPASQIIDAPPEALHDRIVEAMGTALYDNGTEALQSASGPVKLSTEEPVRWTTDLLSKDMHRRWLALVALTGVFLLGLCLDFLRAGRTPLPAILLGAILASIGAAGAFGLAFAGGSVIDSGVDKEVMHIARDGAWLGLRDSLAVAVASAGLILISRTAGWERRGHVVSAAARHTTYYDQYYET